MGLKFPRQDFDASFAFNMEKPLYANTSILIKQNYQDRLSPLGVYDSIQNYASTNDHLDKNIYANLLNNTAEMTKTRSPLLDENNNLSLYENIKTSNSLVTSPIYINFQVEEEKPSLTSISSSLSSTDQKAIEEVDNETEILDQCSNSKMKQTVKKFEVNMSPSWNDKSDLYRTKIPSTITKILPPVRQRRTLHRPRRYRRRSSTPFRAMRRQQQPSKSSAHKSFSNQLYNVGIFEYPIQFHQVLSWYPTDISHLTEVTPQLCSTSDNGESLQQDKRIYDEQEEEEGELCPHETFEDFLLRRRSKSSSSTLASVTNTFISESISYETPTIQSPPLSHRSTDVTLSLDKNDKEFIHEILQRTQNDQRALNRITALKEAYLRAETRKNDLLKSKKPSPMKHSFTTSKIRDELEKYDELPRYRRTIYTEDEEDETYSANDDYRYHHHRRLPPVPSTTTRILHFLITLKRQLQKNFHQLRSRILLELMSNAQHRSMPQKSSDFSPRYRSRPQRTHHPPSRRNINQDFSRTHSNTSTNRPRTFRVTPHSQR